MLANVHGTLRGARSQAAGTEISQMPVSVKDTGRHVLLLVKCAAQGRSSPRATHNARTSDWLVLPRVQVLFAQN